MFSTVSSRWNSLKAAVTWKNSRPSGVLVSMFLASTLSAMPRCSSGGLDHLRDGSRQPGKLPDDERVAFAQEVEGGPELGPVSERSGGLFGEDPLAARRLAFGYGS